MGISSSIMQPVMGPGGTHLNPGADHAARTTGRETGCGEVLITWVNGGNNGDKAETNHRQ